MSLFEQQNFLARLYTDENFRKSFLQKPEKIGAENDLSEKEIKELAAVLPEELNFFADSLFWKRLREVEKFLPFTRKALGEDFSICFRRFSQTYNAQSIKKHLEDAVEFCSFLQKQEIKPVWSKDLAKFERAKLLFNATTKKFIFLKLDFDIRKILKEISDENPRAPKIFPKRKTFAVWLKTGKIKKHIVW